MLNLIYEIYQSWYLALTAALVFVWIILIVVEEHDIERWFALMLVCTVGTGIRTLQIAGVSDRPGWYFWVLFGACITGTGAALLLICNISFRIKYRGLPDQKSRDYYDEIIAGLEQLHDSHKGSQTCQYCGNRYNADKVNATLRKYARQYSAKWARTGKHPVMVKHFLANRTNYCCSLSCSKKLTEQYRKEQKRRDLERNNARARRDIHVMDDIDFYRMQKEWDNAHKKCGNCDHKNGTDCVLRAVTTAGYPQVADDTPGCSEGFKLREDAIVIKRITSRRYRITEQGREEVCDKYL